MRGLYRMQECEYEANAKQMPNSMYKCEYECEINAKLCALQAKRTFNKQIMVIAQTGKRNDPMHRSQTKARLLREFPRDD
jgi:hypothetical protein